MIYILSIDIFIYLAESFLDDYDKTKLIATTKEYYALRFKFTFNNIVKYKMIHSVSYYDSFTNLIVSNTNLSLPKKIKSLTFSFYFDQPIKDWIPNTVNSVTFWSNYSKLTKGCIPNSVKYLTFDHYFNQSIKGCIPESIICLTFGFDFNQAIEDSIPDSVRCLTFGENFNQPIKGCIPNSVIDLTFGWNFNRSIKGCIPNSVTYLTFYGRNKKKLYEHDIPKSVKNIKFIKSSI